MKILSEIAIRLPGGAHFKSLMEILSPKMYKKSEYLEDIKEYRKYFTTGFFLARKGRKIQEKHADRILKLRDRGNYFDYFIIKIPKYDHVNSLLLAAETQSMIIPYVFGLNADFGHEGTYEQFGVQVEPDDIVIDAGAHIGMFTAFAAKYRNAGMVYAFEPVEDNIKVLIETIKINNAEQNAKIVDKALSKENGEGTISLALSGSSIIESRQTNRKVTTTQLLTLDNFVQKNKLKRVDFIKADIEGAERLMLEGARQTLKEFKPKLALCTYHFPDDKEVLTQLIMEANPEYKIHYSKMKLFAK